MQLLSIRKRTFRLLLSTSVVSVINGFFLNPFTTNRYNYLSHSGSSTFLYPKVIS